MTKCPSFPLAIPFLFYTLFVVGLFLLCIRFIVGGFCRPWIRVFGHLYSEIYRSFPEVSTLIQSLELYHPPIRPNRPTQVILVFQGMFSLCSPSFSHFPSHHYFGRRHRYTILGFLHTSYLRPLRSVKGDLGSLHCIGKTVESKSEDWKSGHSLILKTVKFRNSNTIWRCHHYLLIVWFVFGSRPRSHHFPLTHFPFQQEDSCLTKI